MSKKMQKIIMILYIVALIIMVSGATFAYFTTFKIATLKPSIDATAATTDLILFDAGKNIDITPNDINFGEGMGNLNDSTFASAYLRNSHQNPQEAISYKYNLFLDIESNNLVYSTLSKSPELIMQIIDYDGKELTNINGLEYVTVIDGKGNVIKGFDITTKVGKFYLAREFTISAVTEKLHKWEANFIFVNLEEKQDRNFDKGLKGKIKIEKAE